jgi:hypothetical protein
VHFRFHLARILKAVFGTGVADNPHQEPDQTRSIAEVHKWLGFKWVEIVVVLGTVAILLSILVPVPQIGLTPASRTRCRNNLKQIGLALHAYHDVYHAFPPAYTVAANGTPLHSWRTLILPFCDEQQLYDAIDLTKPWNHPDQAAIQAIPEVYRCPAADILPYETTYLANAAVNGCFRPSDPRTLADISDDHSDTLMVIEVSEEEAVHWMSTIDADAEFVLSFGPNTSFAHRAGTHACFVDGITWFLSSTISEAERRTMISIAGNDSADHDLNE